MSDLKTLSYNLTGETIGANNRHSKADVAAGVVKYPYDEKAKKIVYPTGKEWYIFKLIDNTKKGNVYIPNIDDVKNPATGIVERIRLVSGVPSIWVKDQKDLTKEYISQNMVSLRFFRGQKMMRVAAHNTTALEFVRLSNSNIGNPLRVTGSRFEYYEYDASMAEKEAFEKENYELEMAIFAKQEKLEPMKKHAAFLGIRLINDLGEPKTEDGVRREYVMYAKRNPEYFDKTRNTDQVEISWLVRKAIAETLIDANREPGRVYWAQGGGMICVMPQGEYAQKYLTELAMTNTEEGRNFKEQLKKVVT